MSGEHGPISPYMPDARDDYGPRWRIAIAETPVQHGPWWAVWCDDIRQVEFVPQLPLVMTLEDVRALGDALQRMQTWLVAVDQHNAHPTRMAITEEQARRWVEGGGRVSADGQPLQGLWQHGKSWADKVRDGEAALPRRITIEQARALGEGLE